MKFDNIYTVEYKSLNLDSLEINVIDFQFPSTCIKAITYPDDGLISGNLNINTFNCQIMYILFCVNNGMYNDVFISKEEVLDLFDIIYNRLPNNVYIKKMKLAAYFNEDNKNEK